MSDDILDFLKEDLKKSNLVDVDKSSYKSKDEYHNLISIIDNSQNLCNRNFTYSFSGIKSYFIHKFVDQSTVEKKFNLKPDDFFRGALYADYLCNALLCSHDFLEENRFNDRKTLKQLIEKSASYFPNVTRATAFYRNNNHEMKDNSSFRNNSFNARVGVDILLGFTETATVKTLYKKCKGLMDIKACTFMDCILNYLNEEKSSEIIDVVDNRGFYKASAAAYALLYKNNIESDINKVLRD